jgi:copper chaperone CopZ
VSGKVLLSIGLLICCGAGAAAPDSMGLSPGCVGVRAATCSLADTAEVKLAISGMTCGSCATTARIALQRVDGVYDAAVSYDSASAVVLYDPDRTSPDEFISHLEKMTGYKARLAEPAQKPKEKP